MEDLSVRRAGVSGTAEPTRQSPMPPEFGATEREKARSDRNAPLPWVLRACSWDLYRSQGLTPRGQ